MLILSMKVHTGCKDIRMTQFAWILEVYILADPIQRDHTQVVWHFFLQPSCYCYTVWFLTDLFTI